MTTDTTNIDSLAARLRQTEADISDGDFTTAVIAQLDGANGLSTRQRNAILLIATALGSSICAWQLPLPKIIETLQIASSNLPALFGIAIVFTYGTAIAALWTTNRD